MILEVSNDRMMFKIEYSKLERLSISVWLMPGKWANYKMYHSLANERMFDELSKIYIH